MNVQTLLPEINTNILRGYTDENLDGFVGFDYGIGNLNDSVENVQENPGEFTAQVNLQANSNYLIRAKIKNYWDPSWTYGQIIEITVASNSRFGGGGKVLDPQG
jgi:hypothetical protein